MELHLCMRTLPTSRFNQDLSQARRVEGVVRGHASHDLGHAVAKACPELSEGPL